MPAKFITLFAAVPLLVTALLAGCASEPTQANGNWFRSASPAQAGAATQPASANPFAPSVKTAGEPGAYRLQVRFDIIRVMVPIGAVSNSRKIWNYVDEEIVSADWAAHLRRNGLRVGRGDASAWTPIRANLEAISGLRSKALPPFIVARGEPLTLETSLAPHDQVLFMYRPGDAAAPVGGEFRSSVNAWRIEYTVPPTELDAVLLRIMPEIHQRSDETEFRWTGSGFHTSQVSATRVLRELAFEVMMPPDHFVLIGPSSAIKTKLLIGRCLLGEMIDGQPFESLYFITPHVLRSSAVKSP
jgi:hypothetical protein